LEIEIDVLDQNIEVLKLIGMYLYSIHDRILYNFYN